MKHRTFSIAAVAAALAVMTPLLAMASGSGKTAPEATHPLATLTPVIPNRAHAAGSARAERSGPAASEFASQRVERARTALELRRLIQGESRRAGAAPLLRGPSRVTWQAAGAPRLRSSFCGDGLPGADEQCDDGNNNNGDGCSDLCQIEAPFACTGASGSSAIGDGGFEFGGLLTDDVANPFWTETATDNDNDGFAFTPICNAAACLGEPDGEGVFEGDHWAWFGAGIGEPGGAAEVASVSQTVTIPVEAEALELWSLFAACESGLNDSLRVLIDGNAVLARVCTAPDVDFVFNGILLANAAGGPYNDGGTHTITIEGTTRVGLDDSFTNLFVDFVLLGTPTAEPSVCVNNCGNAAPDAGEQCDDGNLIDGDGCSAVCEIEPGFECTAAVAPVPEDAVSDPSFELGGVSTGMVNPFWSEDAGGAFEPICNAQGCSFNVPNTGTHYAFFGGIQDTGGISNNQTVSQAITLPAGASTLSFAALRATCAPVAPADRVEVLLDGNVVDSLLCSQRDLEYQTISVDLVGAPGGPYNDGGVHTLTLRGTTTGIDSNGGSDGQLEWTSVFVDDVNVLTGDVTPPQPSQCVFRDTCFEENFDPGVAGDLAQLGWTQFAAGSAVLDWGTTDDGICLSGPGSPNNANLTGGEGEAACIDTDVFGSGQVESYLCTPQIDYASAVNPDFSVNVNYQNFDSSAEDLFEILVGTAAPDAGSIGGYTSVFATTSNLGGFIGPGATVEAQPTPATAYWCFRYRANFDWWAQIDDVEIVADTCGADADMDGVADTVDNCINIANADQRDSDADGIGNACDGDFDQDCTVNFNDLSFMKAVFFATGDLPEDMTGDETVNFEDLGLLKSFFFNDYTSNNPSGLAGNLCDAG